MPPKRPLRIEKAQYNTVIHIPGYRIMGIIHLPLGGRVSDFMNWNVNQNPFIPVTKATVYLQQTNELLFRTGFLSINRSNISFLAIEEEGTQP